MNFRRVYETVFVFIGCLVLIGLCIWSVYATKAAAEVEAYKCYSMYASAENCPTGISAWFYASVIIRAVSALVCAVAAAFALRRFVRFLLQNNVDQNRISCALESLKKLTVFWSSLLNFVQNYQLLLIIVSVLFSFAALLLPFSSFAWDGGLMKSSTGWEWLILAPVAIVMLLLTPSLNGVLIAVGIALLLLSNLSYLALSLNIRNSKKLYPDFFFFTALLALPIVSPLKGYYFWIISLFLNFLIYRVKAVRTDPNTSITNKNSSQIS